jgi:phytanoyl-CoA hydroxylase
MENQMSIDNPSELKAAYDRDGFVVVRGFLAGSDLAELRSELDRYIREVVPGLPDRDAFYVDRDRPETLKQMQHMQGDPFFRAYCEHPRWRALADLLTGETTHCHGPEWFNKPPGTASPTPPHQDNYYFCLAPPNVVTLWLALDPIDPENGCLRYVRGSHLRPVRDHAASNVLGFSQGITDYGPDDNAAEVLIRLLPGDVVGHHGNLIHRADPNATPDRNRRAFAMVFQGESCRRDEAAFACYMAAVNRQHSSLGLEVSG